MTTERERLERVRAEWLTGRGGEAARLEQAFVLDIAFMLFENRLHPTVDNIRYVNDGKGSPNVIQPAVKVFFQGELQRRLAKPAPLEGVPAPLMTLWAEVLDSAGKIAERSLAERSALVEDRSAAIDAREEDLLQRERTLDQREVDLQALIRTLQQDLDRARSEQAELSQEHRQVLTQLAEQREATAHAVAAAQAQAADHDRTTEEWQDRVAALQAQVEQLESGSAKSAQALDEARSALSEAQQQARIERATAAERLEAALQVAEQARAQVESSSALARTREQELQAALASVREALGVAEGRRDGVQQQLAELQARHAQLVEERRLAPFDVAVLSKSLAAAHCAFRAAGRHPSDEQLATAATFVYAHAVRGTNPDEAAAGGEVALLIERAPPSPEEKR
ncbi:DNA-binding protein [Pseudoxanthomonas kaohsiungensis]|uniref:DNA-binding protein n=1 Tax=Pseudoxanthomonas kaohsiungensis TaxID=283923 RepID=A0ABW3M0U5_9GAMM|nr:DNA-binding protein [Pseudoxanthomonas kaohsiungensis]KAF1702851.1 hypothetical protein CSC66_08750 [Pseudoxanthomonas kaohsiungensis]